VLRNRLGITRVRDMHEAESHALLIAQDAAIEHYGSEHRFVLIRLPQTTHYW
jgi:hypothetical protein